MKKSVVYLIVFSILSIVFLGCTNNPEPQQTNYINTKKYFYSNVDFIINKNMNSEYHFKKSDKFISIKNNGDYTFIKHIKSNKIFAIDKKGILSHKIVEDSISYTFSPYDHLIEPNYIVFK